MAQPWGKKAVRIAIGIGTDADYTILQRFIGHPEIKPLQAQNADALVDYIKWASTVAVQASSAPNIQPGSSASPLPFSNIVVPPIKANSKAVW